MSLIAARQPKTYRWNPGDVISALEACKILGYKSSMNLRDPERAKRVAAEFERYGCTLTLGFIIGNQYRFLRSEIDDFVTAKLAAAQKTSKKRTNDLRIAA